MDIHHLKIFASVFENRSFTKASRQLNITQPTISEHIKNLENSLDCKLFDRLGRSILPTVEAERIYPRAVKIIDELELIRMDITSSSMQVKGVIRIGASTIPGTYLLPVIANDFKALYPASSFEILIEDSEKINEMVRRHDLACGVVGAMRETDNLEYQEVYMDELVLTAAPSLNLGSQVGIHELGKLPFLLREKGSGTRTCMEHFLAGKGVQTSQLHVVATLGSSASIKEAIKAGLGASILSRLAVQEEIDQGKLREIRINNLRMKRPFYLIRHRMRTLAYHYDRFCQFLVTPQNSS